ncbi:hypothetical protein V8G54_006864 [Vigna mungo]|uniref:Uncharacterized protein n=1 Tax=Vigna mungo TaxID=3915 RepID=A0AAQ3P2P2_VIGMU
MKPLHNTGQPSLQKLISLQWVTNYEKLYENRKPLQTSEATFRRSIDGTVRTIFKQLGDEASISSSYISQSMMIHPVIKERKIHILGVLPNGKPIFTDKVNSHFIWDVDPSMCDQDCECNKDDDNSNDDKSDEEDKDTDHEDYCRPFPPPRRRSDPSSVPWIDLHKPKEPDPLWFQKRCVEILEKEGRFSFPQKIPQPLIPCFMIFYSNYEKEFPSLERIVDPITRINTKPNISPSEIGPDGRSKPLTQAEENTDALLEDLSERMKEHYAYLTTEISRLEEEWKKTTFGETSQAKEREIKKLKAQLQDLDHYIESKMKEKQLSFSDPFYPPPFTPFLPLFHPSSSTIHKSKQTYQLPTATTFRIKQKPRTSVPSTQTRKTHTHTKSESPRNLSEKEDYFQDF